MASSTAAARLAAIRAVARRIPRGRVATYGQLAELAGLPRHARLAALAMRDAGPSVPWHRVVGRVSPTLARVAIRDGVGAEVQILRLREEGVDVDAAGRIQWRQFGWVPRRRATG